MEWREMLVSPVPPGSTPSNLGTFHTLQGETPAEFQLILSSTPTRHSRYLPETSSRYRKLKQTPDSVVEICPDASIYASDFAARIGGSPTYPKARPSGAALILDYGTSDTIPINSLRGIRQHRLVNPFTAPGLVDLSADVDFTALADAATLASEGVEVHGPVPQGDFLELMGIRERAEMLTKKPGLEPSAVENITKAWKRLVDRGPGGMGKTYKVLAILPENDGRRRPVGFGGDVTES
jgi:SAM-dependent MidA family methyltransferase